MLRLNPPPPPPPTRVEPGSAGTCAIYSCSEGLAPDPDNTGTECGDYGCEDQKCCTGERGGFRWTWRLCAWCCETVHIAWVVTRVRVELECLFPSVVPGCLPCLSLPHDLEDEVRQWRWLGETDNRPAVARNGLGAGIG